MRNLVRQIHSKSPEKIKHLIRVAYSKLPPNVKFGKDWGRCQEFLSKSEWLPLDELQEMQLAMLKDIVDHAYQNVTYYKESFDKIGLIPSDIKSLKDIELLPFLTKNDVKKNFQKLVACNARKFQPEKICTSGTTGNPLNIYWDKKSVIMEKGCQFRQHMRAGYKLGDRMATLRSINLPRDTYFKLYPDNNLVFAPYNLNPDTVKHYVEKIQDFKPVLVWGWAFMLVNLAKYMKKRNIFLSGVKGIVTSSTQLAESDRVLIERHFNCGLFDYYGLTEIVGSAGQCELRSGYHINLEVGILEVLSNGKPVPDGQLGEIVGTGLVNYAMPLLRYKTGDAATVSAEKCSCGRSLPLIGNIEGRLVDFVVGKKTNWTPHPFYCIHDGLFNIEEIQYVQEVKGQVIIKVVKGQEYTQADTGKLKSNVIRLLGDDMDYEIVFVDKIYEPNSKRQIVKSKVSVEL